MRGELLVTIIIVLVTLITLPTAMAAPEIIYVEGVLTNLDGSGAPNVNLDIVVKPCESGAGCPAIQPDAGNPKMTDDNGFYQAVFTINPADVGPTDKHAVKVSYNAGVNTLVDWTNFYPAGGVLDNLTFENVYIENLNTTNLEVWNLNVTNVTHFWGDVFAHTYIESYFLNGLVAEAMCLSFADQGIISDLATDSGLPPGLYPAPGSWAKPAGYTTYVSIKPNIFAAGNANNESQSIWGPAVPVTGNMVCAKMSNAKCVGTIQVKFPAAITGYMINTDPIWKTLTGGCGTNHNGDFWMNPMGQDRFEAGKENKFIIACCV